MYRQWSISCFIAIITYQCDGGREPRARARREREREKTQLVKIIIITRRRRRCPYWFIRKVFPSPSSLSLRFYWWMVSVQCGLSVTKYWRIKMLLRKSKGVIYKPVNMLDVKWLVVRRWISERKSEREEERSSPPDHIRVSYLSAFVFVLLLRWSAKSEKKKKGRKRIC